MKAPQVWINDELIDTDGMPLKIERANSLFDAEPIKGEYSYPFTWPLTERNRRLLGNPQEFALLDDPLTFSVRYMSLGEVVDGLLYVDAVTWDSNALTGTIQGNLVGTEGILANAFGTMKLAEMELEVIDLPDTPVYTGIHPGGGGGGGITIKSRACEFATGVTNGTYTGYPFVFPMIFWPDYRDRADWDSAHTDGSGAVDGQYFNKDSAIELPYDCVNYWSQIAQIFGKNEADYGSRGFTLTSNFIYATECYPMMVIVNNDEPGATNFDGLNRIIPMLKVKWLLTRIFNNLGYALEGDILTDPSFEKLFVVNNYSINKWVLTDPGTSPAIEIEDTCDSINLANHVPDMKIVDYLNATFSWLGLVPKITSGTVTLYTISEILAMEDYPITCQRNPQVVKTLTDTYGKGMSMKYTWPKVTYADNRGAGRIAGDYLSRFGSMIEQLPTPPVYIEVADFAALPAPTLLNKDQIALVVNEQAFYKQLSGVWKLYGQNLVDHIEENSNDRVINASVPVLYRSLTTGGGWVQVTATLPWGLLDSHSTNYCLPAIKAAGSYRTDTYLNYKFYYQNGNSTVLNDIGKDKFNSFPLMMLFYHGMMGVTGMPGETDIPFSSPYQIDPDMNIIGPWDLSLVGSRSLYAHFFTEWSAIIKRLVKYTVVIYPDMADSMATDMYSPKSLLQQRMLPYKATYYEPFNGEVSFDMYKVKDEPW